MKNGTPGRHPEKTAQASVVAACLHDQHSFMSHLNFTRILYSDRVGRREGGGRGEPLPDVCARARFRFRCGFVGFGSCHRHGAAASFARFSSNSCAFRDLMD